MAYIVMAYIVMAPSAFFSLGQRSRKNGPRSGHMRIESEQRLVTLRTRRTRPTDVAVGRSVGLDTAEVDVQALCDAWPDATELISPPSKRRLVPRCEEWRGDRCAEGSTEWSAEPCIEWIERTLIGVWRAQYNCSAEFNERDWHDQVVLVLGSVGPRQCWPSVVLARGSAGPR